MFRLLSLLVVITAGASIVWAQESVSRPRQIRVQTGETLASVAEKYHISIDELAEQNRLHPNSALRKGQRLLIPALPPTEPTDGAEIIGKRIKFADGRTIEVDEAWREGTTIWYRRGGMTQSLDTEVKAIEPILASKKSAAPPPAEPKTQPTAAVQTFIYLVGGAKFKVDNVSETATGAWYSRGNLSNFLERERIARIVREEPSVATNGRRSVDWSTGNARIDELIKINGERYGVDPYLVFCVIEQESHFRSQAVSPKGARGLMQLMPSTARRYGVRNTFDVAENIKGGTQYLKELMGMFGGQVNLVLASYNAGEGAVLKYGRNVPPYQETREYVKRISKRYGLGAREKQDSDDQISPRR